MNSAATFLEVGDSPATEPFLARGTGGTVTWLVGIFGPDIGTAQRALVALVELGERGLIALGAGRARSDQRAAGGELVAFEHDNRRPPTLTRWMFGVTAAAR